MPKPSQSGKKRFFYNLNLKRDKSNKKYKNLTDHTISLIKRIDKEGMTKLLANALNKAQVKIKSYGITFAQMVSALEHKGLAQFTEALNTHLVFVQKKGHNVSISYKRDVLKQTSKIILSDETDKKPAAKKEVVKKETTTKTAAPKKPAAKKEVVKKETTTKTAAPKKTTTKKEKA